MERGREGERKRGREGEEEGERERERERERYCATFSLGHRVREGGHGGKRMERENSLFGKTGNTTPKQPQIGRARV